MGSNNSCSQSLSTRNWWSCRIHASNEDQKEGHADCSLSLKELSQYKRNLGALPSQQDERDDENNTWDMSEYLRARAIEDQNTYD